MQAAIGQRRYYACVMKLSAIPKMFTFTEWMDFTPEDREQRVLNRKRIPDIARYILDNEDGYIFSSITASYRCEVKFDAVGTDGLGYLEMEFEDAHFVINDGQHRCAAIAQAIRENPGLGDEAISVLLFPYENRERVQQMFSDLNRYVVKTSRSLDILFDKRDLLSKLTLEVCERVAAFQGMVDKDAVHSLPARSEKMFSLAALYDANEELLIDKRNGDDVLLEDLIATAAEYWTAISEAMPDWAKVKEGRVRPVELRQEKICTHAVVLRALGGLGAELMRRWPAEWRSRVGELRVVDWSKRNREWENVCMVANSVVSNRQARLATKAHLKRKLGLPLSEAEERSVVRPGGNELGPGAADGGTRPDPAHATLAGGSGPNGRLSMRDWDILLIEVLQSFPGGKGRKPDAEAEAYRRAKAVFDQHYGSPVAEGIPAWKKQFQWAWDRAKRRGYGEPPERVGHGVWQLTQKGLGLNARGQLGHGE